MNGKVSIITPSFNRGYIVHETAESIFKQTYANWEWIIVDDGSTDNSLEILQSYAKADPRVRVLQRNREPKGACACRNIAVENSTGDYVIFLDTDDLLATFCLEQRVKAIEELSECDFVIFPMLLFKNKPDDLRLLWNIDKEDDDLLRIMKGDAICQGTGTIWKKSSFQKVGMWKEDLKLWQDIELHIRSLLWPVKYAKRMDLMPDVFLRVSDDSLSRVGYYSMPKMHSRINVYDYTCERIEKLGLTTKYKEGIRAMGADVLVSAIRSKYYDGTKHMLRLCRRYKIFDSKELNLFERYALMTKLKLYRLPFLFKPVEKKAESMAKVNSSTLSKYKIETPITI